MNLLKTTFWTTLSTGIRLLAGFVVAKVLAVYLGPVGFAIVGQFQNFTTMVLSFSGNMIQGGMIKYVAEFKNNSLEKINFLSSGFYLCVISSLIMGLLLIIFRHNLALLFLKNVGLSWVMIVFGLTLIFYVLNTFIISVLNGEGAVKRMTFANMASSILGLILTVCLVYYFRLPGALLALVLSQSLVFIVSFFLLVKAKFFHWQDYYQRFSKTHGKKLLQFALMSITSAIMLPLTQIFIREYIGHVLSWQDAGFWQAVTRISDAYLLLITSTIIAYYLPKLSSLQTAKELKAEMHRTYLQLMPLVVVLAVMVYLFKRVITLLLFSNAFLPMENLFLFQLIGDVLKIGSWLMAYNMLAKAMTRLFIFTEIFFNLTFIFFTVVFIHWFGLRGVTVAFAFNYLLNWLFMWQFVYKKLVMT